MILNRLIKTCAALTGLLMLSGCATQQPRYGNDGVYYEQPRVHRSSVHVSPMIYPYWSLDYFYFSRHYHPYSVIVHRYDPWYYPYPGWYYGYRPGLHARVSLGFGHYPWHAFGGHYYGYQPWRPLYVSYPRHHQPVVTGEQRVRQLDERLRETERRERALAARQQQRLDPDPSIAGSSRSRTGALTRDRRAEDRRARSTLPPGIQRERLRGRVDIPTVRQPPADTVRSGEHQPAERRQAPAQSPQRSPSPPRAATPTRQRSPRSDRATRRSEPATRQSAPRPRRDSSSPLRQRERQRER
ncbi:MAG: hypothetical protein ACNA7J_11730 [Wenzhouxiangella sp.]